jgi:hypothetical protein
MNFADGPAKYKEPLSRGRRLLSINLTLAEWIHTKMSMFLQNLMEVCKSDITFTLLVFSYQQICQVLFIGLRILFLKKK